MKKILLIVLIFASTWDSNFAHDGDTTCIGNCKDTTMSTLIGEWAYTNFAYRIVDRVHACDSFITDDDVFLKFDFDANGTYTKTFGNSSKETIETGTWDVSDDNASVVLFPNNNPTAEFIKLGKLENEEIELELNIESAGLSDLFCTQINVLNFSKNILPLSNTVIR